MASIGPYEASLILDHAMGDRSIPTAITNAFLSILPFPSRPTPRLLAGVLLRRLAAQLQTLTPLSTSLLDSIELLHSIHRPDSNPLAADAYLAVAAHLAVSAADFDAAATDLFGAGGRGRVHLVLGGGPAAAGLATPALWSTADQMDGAIGRGEFERERLVRRWGDAGAAVAKVRALVEGEWEKLELSILEMAAEKIAGEKAGETWRGADEETRAKFALLVGKTRSHEILTELGESASNLNPMPTPEIDKVAKDLKSSWKDLLNAVEDPLPDAVKTAAGVLSAMLGKAVDLSAQDVIGPPVAHDIAGPSAVNDKSKGPTGAVQRSLMDWNPTAQTYEWDDSIEPDSDGSEAQLAKPSLPSPRRTTVSPLQLAQNKAVKRRKPKKWSSLEEETLRKAVQKYGSSNWKDILANDADVFVDRTAVDLKDKWRNMTRH